VSPFGDDISCSQQRRGPSHLKKSATEFPCTRRHDIRNRSTTTANGGPRPGGSPERLAIQWPSHPCAILIRRDTATLQSAKAHRPRRLGEPCRGAMPITSWGSNELFFLFRSDVESPLPNYPQIPGRGGRLVHRAQRIGEGHGTDSRAWHSDRDPLVPTRMGRAGHLIFRSDPLTCWSTLWCQVLTPHNQLPKE